MDCPDPVEQLPLQRVTVDPGRRPFTVPGCQDVTGKEFAGAAHMRRNDRLVERHTVAQEITTQAVWDALPVGTVVSVDYFETGEPGEDEQTMTVIRVAENVLAAAGQHRLAGGAHWSDMWHYQQGVTVLELSPVVQPTPEFQDALIQAQIAAKEAFQDNRWEAEKFGRLSYEERMKPENVPPPMPWMAIVAKLVELGWAPPVSVPEATQN